MSTPALALQFALRGTDRVMSSLLMALGVAGVTILALATLGAPHVAADRAARTEAVSPQIDYDGSTADPSQLRMIDPFNPQGRRWNGHAIEREYYARGSSNLTAPGVERMPDAGEYVASPALTNLIESDRTVAALFSGMSRIGEIGSYALVQPRELRAVLGVSGDARTPLLVQVDGFGGPPTGVIEDRTNLNRLVSFFVLAIIWLPVGAFILVLSRLSSRQRSRRARSLRLVGMSRRSVLLLHVIEASAICAPAALVGALLFDQMAIHMTSVPGTEIGFFGEPARAGWMVSTIVALLVVGAFSASAAFAIQRSVETRSAGPKSVPSGDRRPWGLRILVAGLGLLVVAPALAGLFGGVGFISLWVGCALVALGTGIAGPILVARAMRWTGPKMPSTSAFVGFRLGAVETSSIRLAGMFSVVLIMLLGGLAFMNVLNGGSDRSWDERLANQSRVPVVVDDLVGELDLQEVRSIAPNSGAVETYQVRHDQKDVPIVVGACADLEHLAGVAARNCSSSPQWIVSEGTPTQIRPTGTIKLPGGASVQLPDSASAVQLPSRAMPPAFRDALLVPSNLAPAAPPFQSSTFLLLVKNNDLEHVMGTLSSGSPQLQFDLGGLDYHNPDTRAFPTQVRWLTVGTIVALLLGVAATAAAGLGESGERATRMRGLRVLGARRRFILGTHLWATVTPIAALGMTAVVIAWFVCSTMENVDDRAAIQASAFVNAGTAVLAAALVVGLITYPAAIRRSTRNAGVDA